MKIRKAIKQNLKEIGKLMKSELSKPPFNEKDSIKSVLKSLNFYHKNGKIYFVEDNGRIIGVIVFQVEEWWEGKVIIIQDLIEKSKNKDVRTNLIKFIEKYAITKDVKRIYFETNKKSPDIKFYQKLGYKINKDRVSLSKKL